MKNKTGKKITCMSKKCKEDVGGYTWLTTSKNLYVSCPRCLNKVKVPK